MKKRSLKRNAGHEVNIEQYEVINQIKDLRENDEERFQDKISQKSKKPRQQKASNKLLTEDMNEEESPIKKVRKRQSSCSIKPKKKSESSSAQKRSNQLLQLHKSRRLRKLLQNSKSSQGHQMIEEDEQYYEGRCSICLEMIAQRAKPTECSHIFCLTCILSWNKFSDVCPLCKKQMTELLQINEEGRVDGKIPIQKPQILLTDALYEQELQNLFNSMASSCYECGKDDNEHLLLFCEGCDFQLCHSYCCGLGNSIPETEWICKYCISNQKAKARLKTQRKKRKIIQPDEKNTQRKTQKRLKRIDMNMSSQDHIQSELDSSLSESISDSRNSKSQLVEILKNKKDLYIESDESQEDSIINYESHSTAPENTESHKLLRKKKSMESSVIGNGENILKYLKKNKKSNKFVEEESIEDKLSVAKEDMNSLPQKMKKRKRKITISNLIDTEEQPIQDKGKKDKPQLKEKDKDKGRAKKFNRSKGPNLQKEFREAGFEKDGFEVVTVSEPKPIKSSKHQISSK